MMISLKSIFSLWPIVFIRPARFVTEGRLCIEILGRQFMAVAAWLDMQM